MRKHVFVHKHGHTGPFDGGALIRPDIDTGGSASGGSGSGGSSVALSDDTPLVESGSGSAGSSAAASRGDHVHPEVEGSRWELAVITGSPPDPLYADGDFLYILV